MNNIKGDVREHGLRQAQSGGADRIYQQLVHVYTRVKITSQTLKRERLVRFGAAGTGTGFSCRGEESSKTWKEPFGTSFDLVTPQRLLGVALAAGRGVELTVISGTSLVKSNALR